MTIQVIFDVFLKKLRMLDPLTTLETASLWLGFGGNVFRDSGNVGIGTSTPETKLEIAGQVKITGGDPGIGKVLTSDANGIGTWKEDTSELWAKSETNDDIYRLDGNVGIGTEEPSELFSLGDSADGHKFLLYDDGNQYLGFGVLSAEMYSFINGSGSHFSWYGDQDRTDKLLKLSSSSGLEVYKDLSISDVTFVYNEELISEVGPNNKGSDDILVSGEYTLDDEPFFHVEIVNNSFTFIWKKGELGEFSDPITMTGNPILLQDGISVNWSHGPGHSIGDYWEIINEKSINTNESIHVSRLKVNTKLNINPSISINDIWNITMDTQGNVHKQIHNLFEAKFVNGTNPLDAVYMDGNVGIGTEEPSELLHVQGNIKGGPNFELSTVNGYIALRSSSTNFGVLIRKTTTNLYTHIKTIDAGSYISHNQLIPHLLIAPNGNIGIGTEYIQPQAKLHVDGDFKIKNALFTYENITHDPVYLSDQTGLDDLSSSGLYTSTGNTYFVVRIASVSQNPNTVYWSEGEGPLSAPMDITGLEQLMQNGVSFTFNSAIGHTLHDEWIISAGTQVEIDKPIHIDGTGEFEGDVAIKGHLRSYSLLRIKDGIRLTGGATVATNENVLKFAVGGSETTLSLNESGLLESNIPNYELLVTEDEHIPNKKYVDNAIPQSSNFKYLNLVGYTGNQQSGSVTIAHGISDLTKIKSISIHVYTADNDNLWPPNTTNFNNYEYGYKIGIDGVAIQNVVNNSANILNKPVYVFITYVE